MDNNEQDEVAATDVPGDAGELALHPSADDVSGLIRRVRRLVKLSQRELAEGLGVSQSAVAKWETGRTSPSARMLARVLDLARLTLAAVKVDGERVPPMKSVAARDAAGRRYPAHAYVWAEGWWAPQGAEMTSWLGDILLHSKVLGLPRVRYSRWWQHSRPPSLADLHEHPTWAELVAEAHAGWTPRQRQLVHIPDWALQDSRRSRNRRPDDFRRLAGAIGRARERARHG